MEGAYLDISWNCDGSIKAHLTPDRKTVYIGADGGINASDCRAMFYGLDKIEEIVFEKDAFHTDLSTNFAIMFCDCSSLTELDLSSFDTSKASWFDDMFEGCTALVKLTLGEKFVIPPDSRTDDIFSGYDKLDKTKLPGMH